MPQYYTFFSNNITTTHQIDSRWSCFKDAPPKALISVDRFELMQTFSMTSKGAYTSFAMLIPFLLLSVSLISERGWRGFGVVENQVGVSFHTKPIAVGIVLSVVVVIKCFMRRRWIDVSLSLPFFVFNDDVHMACSPMSVMSLSFFASLRHEFLCSTLREVCLLFQHLIQIAFNRSDIRPESDFFQQSVSLQL